MQFITLRNLTVLLAVLVCLVSIVRLEGYRSEVGIESTYFGATPVRIYRGPQTDETLVIVSHGFAGSVQMMEAISLSLARAGHVVVAFDYIGHGRHPGLLSPDITTLTGTTEDLVLQTLEVTAEAQAYTGVSDVAFVGHSMATDVVIRAAERVGANQGVAAISMYSEAVVPDHPKRLLIVSGAQEERLRGVALEAVAQIGPAEEGGTAEDGGVVRRAVAAPFVGHVGVLWSGVTASEITEWFGDTAVSTPTGPWISALLFSLIVLFRPLTEALPDVVKRMRIPLQRSVIASFLASATAVGVATLVGPIFGVAGFGALAGYLAVWGVVALVILRPRIALRRYDLAAAIVLLFWGLVVFALALDRYGAAFLPTGSRLALFFVLVPAGVLFAFADRVLVDGKGIAFRAVLRMPVLLGLGIGMFVQPESMGIIFTVLPVFVLFFLVYGTMAHWLSRRVGPTGPSLASGVILSWSFAASTPLFASSLN